MADCCLIKKVATVEVYENKNEVRAYGFMAGDRNTPVMEVRFKHLWGESNLSTCKLRWIIVDDVGSLLVGEVPIQSDNTALINLPNELFTGDRRMKVQLTVASCDGERILNLQQFTDLKVINSLATNEVVQPVYQLLINQLYDDTKVYLSQLETSYSAKYGSLETLYANSKASLEQYLVTAENGGNAEFLQGYAPHNFKKTEDTIANLQASTKYKLGEVVELLGYYTAGDGAGYKRKIEAVDDGSGVLLANGLWANKVKTLKDINLINTYDALRKLRSNKHSISFTLMGDSIWFRPTKAGATSYLGNGESEVYTQMINNLNIIYKNKLTVSENLTFPGDDASRAFDRYKNNKFKGDIVLICYGANDTKFDSGTQEDGTCFPVDSIKGTLDRHRTFMKKLIEKVILEGKVPVIIGCTAPRVTTQNKHEEVDPNRQNMILMSDLDKEIADEYGALYICAYDYMKNYTDDIFAGADEVHPDRAMTSLGKRLASNFIGLITENSKYKTTVNNSLDLGLRKNFDNFMTSSEITVEKSPDYMWTNSGEYTMLQEGEWIVYSFYTDEPVIVYPQVRLHVPCNIRAGIDFATRGAYESPTIIDKNHEGTTIDLIDMSRYNGGTNKIFTSPSNLLEAKNLNKDFEPFIAGMKVMSKGFHTVYLTSTSGYGAVLGLRIEKISNMNYTSRLDYFSNIDDFNLVTQEGEFASFSRDISIVKNAPPNYSLLQSGVLTVKATYENFTPVGVPLIIKQNYKNTQGEYERYKYNGEDWTKWNNVESLAPEIIWEVVTDFNNINDKMSLWANLTHAQYIAMSNKPVLAGSYAIFEVYKTKNILSVKAISNVGEIAFRQYDGSSWGAWTYSKSVVTALNNPYHATKMQEEGIYGDFIEYMDSKTEYDRVQRYLETQRQETFEQRENQEQTYEEWLAQQPVFMPAEEEPQPSKALLDFKNRYIG